MKAQAKTGTGLWETEKTPCNLEIVRQKDLGGPQEHYENQKKGQSCLFDRAMYRKCCLNKQCI